MFSERDVFRFVFGISNVFIQPESDTPLGFSDVWGLVCAKVACAHVNYVFWVTFSLKSSKATAGLQGKMKITKMTKMTGEKIHLSFSLTLRLIQFKQKDQCYMLMHNCWEQNDSVAPPRLKIAGCKRLNHCSYLTNTQLNSSKRLSSLSKLASPDRQTNIDPKITVRHTDTRLTDKQTNNQPPNRTTTVQTPPTLASHI